MGKRKGIGDYIAVAFVVGLALLLIIAVFGMTWELGYDRCSKKLGQAICDQEYDMDYRAYERAKGEVKIICQPKPEEPETYDGIEVEIG